MFSQRSLKGETKNSWFFVQEYLNSNLYFPLRFWYVNKKIFDLQNFLNLV